MQRRPEMQVRVHGRNADLQPVQLSGRHLHRCKSRQYRPLHVGAFRLLVPWPRILPQWLPWRTLGQRLAQQLHWRRRDPGSVHGQMQRRPEMQVRVHGRNADLQPVQLSGRHLFKSPRYYTPLHVGAFWVRTKYLRVSRTVCLSGVCSG